MAKALLGIRSRQVIRYAITFGGLHGSGRRGQGQSLADHPFRGDVTSINLVSLFSSWISQGCRAADRLDLGAPDLQEHAAGISLLQRAIRPCVC